MSTTAYTPSSAIFSARVMRLKDGRAVAVRAARPDDAPAVQRFVRGLSARSLRNRFFAPVRELSPDQLDRLTRPRDPRELALLAEITEGTQTPVVALAQHALSDPPNAEFALVVDDSCQRQGLGTRLIAALADHAACVRLAAFVGFVLADNWPMLALLARLGFSFEDDADPRLIRALDGQELDLAIDIMRSGKLRIKDSSNNTLGTTSQSIITKGWVRIEWQVDHRSGSVEVKLFNAPNEVTPTETLRTSGARIGAVTDRVQIGRSGTQASSSVFWTDDPAISAARYLGPVPGTAVNRHKH